jgi:hypothetical protein
MSNWQTDLTTGIQNFVRKFEDAEEQVGYRPKIKREYDNTLARLREAEVAVSAFIEVYDEESRK